MEGWRATRAQSKLNIWSFFTIITFISQEVNLPHTPRALAFSTPTVLVFAYTATDHAVFSLDSLSSSELELPSPPATNAPSAGANLGSVGLGMGMTALTGLGGYVGLGAKAKPTVVKISEGEVLIPKESESHFFPVNLTSYS